MNLSKVWLSWISGYSRSVFDGDSEVSIALNAMACDEFNLGHLILREGVKGLAVNREYFGAHELRCLSFAPSGAQRRDALGPE